IQSSELGRKFQVYGLDNNGLCYGQYCQTASIHWHEFRWYSTDGNLIILKYDSSGSSKSILHRQSRVQLVRYSRHWPVAVWFLAWAQKWHDEGGIARLEMGGFGRGLYVWLCPVGQSPAADRGHQKHFRPYF